MKWWTSIQLNLLVGVYRCSVSILWLRCYYIHRVVNAFEPRFILFISVWYTAFATGYILTRSYLFPYLCSTVMTSFTISRQSLAITDMNLDLHIDVDVPKPPLFPCSWPASFCCAALITKKINSKITLISRENTSISTKRHQGHNYFGD